MLLIPLHLQPQHIFNALLPVVVTMALQHRYLLIWYPAIAMQVHRAVLKELET